MRGKSSLSFSLMKWTLKLNKTLWLKIVQFSAIVCRIRLNKIPWKLAEWLFSALESTPDIYNQTIWRFLFVLTDAGTGSTSRKAVLDFATSENRKSQYHCRIGQPHSSRPLTLAPFWPLHTYPNDLTIFFLLSKLISEPEVLLGKLSWKLQRRRMESQKISELTELAGL